MSDASILVRIFYGIANPQSFGPLGPDKVILDPTTGRIELLDCCGDPLDLYKAFANKPVTLRGVSNKSLKWFGYLGCKETKGNYLYIKDLLKVPS